jgi:hypothetical protein
MKSREFHKLTSDHFRLLSEQGFKKGGTSSTWRLRLNPSLEVEFAVRLNPDGWYEQYGGEFIYELRPILNKEYLYDKVRQLRLLELKQFDSNLLDNAHSVLRAFTSKLPIFEGWEADDHYLALRSLEYRPHVEHYASTSQWFYYYDRQDVVGWHEVATPALLKAIAAQVESYRDERLHTTHQSPSRVEVTVDPTIEELGFGKEQDESK